MRSTTGAVAVLALLGACATEQYPLTLQPTRDVRADDYERVLERWTRKDEVYDGLDSKLFVWVTFHSPEFRRAFLLRHVDVYGPGSEEASRLLLTSPEAEEHLEFFFSASTGSPTWNDFDKESSIWRVTLEGEDHERVDGKVERVKATANLRVIYPYITDFSRTYAVRFPRTTPSGRPVISASSKVFTLRMSSALGTAKLEWRLEPTSKAPAGTEPERAPLPDKPVEPDESPEPAASQDG
ncbi:hypothetical protein L6R52_35995 [Myxococcota bacterium]|nr:hypothetical protein [Myxococcota bacterium]